MTDDVCMKRYKWRGLTWILTEHGADHFGLYVCHDGVRECAAILGTVGPGNLAQFNLDALVRSHRHRAIDKLRAYQQAIPYPLDLLLIEDDDAFIAALCAYEATA